MRLALGILLDALFVILLTWCTISDIRSRTVPNRSIILLLYLGFTHIVYILFCSGTWWQYLAGPLLTVPFFIAWLKNGMGAGDVKLIAAIALYLGLINTVVAFALMVPILAALLLRSLLSHQPKKNRIPLAPVISIGAAGAVALGYILHQLANH